MHHLKSRVKKTLRFFTMLFAFGFYPLLVQADVCSEGTAIPPFLDAGAVPNLMMVIDNSASMLDMAYVDKFNETRCFDENYLQEDDGTFNAEKVYIGYFERYETITVDGTETEGPVWYEWVDSEVTVYAGGSEVDEGLVIRNYNGRLYKATCTPPDTGGICTFIGTTPINDTALEWTELNQGSVVVWSPGWSLSADGPIVSHQGMLYQKKAGSDTSITFKYNEWDRLDGYFKRFEKLTDQSEPSCPDAEFYHIVDDGTDSGRKDFKISFKDPANPVKVTCFAGTGNFLNWSTASKFDIEKKILTGGKFYEGVAGVVSEDKDGDGIWDPNDEDLDGDGYLDRGNEDTDGDTKLDYNEDLAQGLDPSDGRLDSNEDVDGDGNLDVNEDTIIVNGLLDAGEDLDGDGKLDLVDEDKDGDGVLGLLDRDFDGDGYFDFVDEDVDRDGVLDIDEDIDHDGKLDIIDEDEDDDGFLDVKSIDTNGNGTLDTNPTADDLLISEHRGCSGKGFTKEIPVKRLDENDVEIDQTLILRVRGPGELIDKIDGSDFTSRFEILGLGGAGGIDVGYCELYLNELDKAVDLEPDDPKLPLLRSYLQGCMYGDMDAEVQEVFNIYHSSVHDCWKLATGKDPVHSGNLASQCQAVYQGEGKHQEIWEQKDPWEIVPWDPEYICYGQWNDADTPDAADNWQGTGYIGRCWEDYPTQDGQTCVQKSCDCDESEWDDADVDNSGNCYVDVGTGGDTVGNSCVGGLRFQCAQGKKIQNNTYECQNDVLWERISVVKDSDPEIICVGSGTKNGCDVASDYNQGCWGTVEEGWTSGGKQADDCITQAERDYCGGLSLPGVKDPTDLSLSGDSTSSATWGVVAALIDSAVFSQLGVDAPMLTMKGYVEYKTPDEQTSDAPERPDGPQGKLFEVTDNEDFAGLRLGVMAFRDDGSKSECTRFNSTCDRLAVPGEPFRVCDIDPESDACGYCSARGSIDKYCQEIPINENYDGAQVITPVGRGKKVDSNGVENWGHYIDLITAINDTPATTWTPLAEAVFVALGYFGQNADFRLNPTDFLMPDDDLVKNSTDDAFKAKWADPVQSWCQESHLLIITEGASTADISPRVEAFVTANPDTALTFDGSEDSGDDSACVDGLEGSTFFDDTTWFGRNADVTRSADPDATTLPSTIAPDGTSFYKELIRKYPDNSRNRDYEKSPVTTHIITTGALRGELNGNECEPVELMTQAAHNGASPQMLAENSNPLLPGEAPEDFQESLEALLRSLFQRTSTGSAASVISSSRSGEGAVYQAVFWPEIARSGDQGPLVWTGDVHSLFLDDFGRMWDDYDGDGIFWSEDIDGDGRLSSEDTNNNGVLDAGEDLNLNGVLDIESTDVCLDGDRRLFYNYDGDRTLVCFNEECETIGACAARTTPVEIQNFHSYLWSTTDQLGLIDSANLSVNRVYAASIDGVNAGQWVWTTAFPKRFIFTWNDLDNDGIVDQDPTGSDSTPEVIELVAGTNWDNFTPAADATIHHSILDDFQVETAAELDDFIEWFRGSDILFETDTDLNGDGVVSDGYVYRCRRLDGCDSAPADLDPANNPDHVERRLGDIVHSTPKLVGPPAEAFQNIYRDGTYAHFIERYRYRRNTIYFGANDGMLHAVNGGFPKITDTEQLFAKGMTRDPSNGFKPVYGNVGPELGTELWAYLPYNLQPHVGCTADHGYGSAHKFYVDKEPRIFDMKIFKEESVCTDSTGNGYFDENCVHPKGWGTILVGSMRFGGAPIVAAENGWPDTDNRKFISSYFILDITDPERPPRILAEMTMTVTEDPQGVFTPVEADFGFSTPMPAGVVMRELGSFGSPQYFWYLIFGNGPETLDGENSQQGKLGVLPMSWLEGIDNGIYNAGLHKAFRVPDSKPTSIDNFHEGGRIPIEVYDDSGALVEYSDVRSFTSDLITADLDLLTEPSPYGGLYKSDAVYFGTVDGPTSLVAPDFIYDPPDSEISKWNGGGRAMRLVTRELSTILDPDDNVYYPVSTPPGKWYFRKLMDTKEPISGALSLGWDGANFWVYFGTGRFFSTKDKTDDAINYFFGVKEPLTESCEMNWNEIMWSSSSATQTLYPNNLPGERGLLRSDYIDVFESADLGSSEPLLYCDSTTDCYLGDLRDMGNGNRAYEDLRRFVAGASRDDTKSGGTCDFNSPAFYLDNSDPVNPLNDVYPGVDGWYRVLQQTGERVVGQSTLLGGLITFSSYIPDDGQCNPEGTGNLYGVHYQMGTAWHKNVFGLEVGANGHGYDAADIVSDKYVLGQGMATTPSLHVGTGEPGPDAKAIIQTSTGEIIEIEQENLPLQPPKSGLILWSDRAQ